MEHIKNFVIHNAMVKDLAQVGKSYYFKSGCNEYYIFVSFGHYDLFEFDCGRLSGVNSGKCNDWFEQLMNQLMRKSTEMEMGYTNEI